MCLARHAHQIGNGDLVLVFAAHHFLRAAVLIDVEHHRLLSCSLCLCAPVRLDAEFVFWQKAREARDRCDTGWVGMGVVDKQLFVFVLV